MVRTEGDYDGLQMTNLKNLPIFSRCVARDAAPLMYVPCTCRDSQVFEGSNYNVYLGKLLTPSIIIPHQVMVLLTDGNQTGPELIPNQIPLVDAVQPIKDLGVKIIAIGIGMVDRKQLETLATDPNDILESRSFEELLTLVKETVGKSCRGMDIMVFKKVCP